MMIGAATLLRYVGLPLLLAGLLAGSEAFGAPAVPAPSGKKSGRILFAPKVYERLVIVRMKSKERKYYAFTPARPLQIEVIGPTTLTVAVRLFYEVSMKGQQSYTILEEVKGAPLQSRTHRFTTKKSPVSALPGDPERVPSRGDIFTIEVPAGPHTYLLHLKDTSAAFAAARILIPRSHLKNGGP